MKVKLTLVSVVVAIALVGAGCQEVQKPRSAWGAGMNAEFRRLGATLVGGSVGTTAAGASFNDTWEYESNGPRGHITAQVLP